MTHLYIEQNNSVTEEVNSSIISKLYELAINGNLDNTSDLKGRLHSTSAKEAHITYFSTHYPDLYVTADKLYIPFTDPIIENYLKSTWGDGVGVLLSDAANYTVLSFPELNILHFENNTQITSFNELGRFKTIKEVARSCFRNASNLAYIDLSNIEIIGYESFCGAGIRTLNLPNLKGFKDHRDSLLRGGGSHFKDCKSLTSVTIGPYLLNYLTGSWFLGCTELTNITIQSSIDELPGNFCYGCSSLINANVDWSSVTFRVGDNAFRGCSDLEQHDLTLIADELGDRCFAGCKKLTGKITINNNTCTIGANIFEGCTGLTSALFSGNTSLGNSMFYQCSNLLSVTGLSNVTKLQGGMFLDCRKLSTIDIDFSKITELGARVFESCTSLNILNLSMPNLTKTIGERCFYRVPISTVSNLGSCTEIGINAFLGITTLTSVTLPNTVTKIGGSAFQNCSNLQTINIPSSVTQIEGSAFNGCSNLAGTFNLSNVTTFAGKHTFRDCRNVTISGFPRSSIYDERVFLHTGNTSITIPNTVTTIGIGAFMYCYNLLALSFESNSQLQTIDTSAFANCTALLSVVFPEGLTTIKGKIFEACSALTSVDIPSTVTYIGNEVFKSTSVTTLIVRATTPPSVHDYIFNGLSSRCTIYVPAASVNTYKNAATWSTRASHIQAISA